MKLFFYFFFLLFLFSFLLFSFIFSIFSALLFLKRGFWCVVILSGVFQRYFNMPLNYQDFREMVSADDYIFECNLCGFRYLCGKKEFSIIWEFSVIQIYRWAGKSLFFSQTFCWDFCFLTFLGRSFSWKLFGMSKVCF